MGAFVVGTGVVGGSGSVNTITVLSVVEHPFLMTTKLVYVPAVTLGIVNTPEASAVSVILWGVVLRV